jgi:hypothetical protein
MNLWSGRVPDLTGLPVRPMECRTGKRMDNFIHVVA